jgi:hypothetical protein
MLPHRHTQAIILLVIISITVLNQSCVEHTLPAPDQFSCASFEQVSFEADIMPIIDAKCAIVGDGGCHNGGNGPSRDWRQFSNVQANATSIKDRVTRPPGTNGHMPAIGSLTDEHLRLLVCWVEQGAQDN